MAWLFVISLTLLGGCGPDVHDDDADMKSERSVSEAQEDEKNNEVSHIQQAGRTLHGYVSPIDLTVDGETFGAGGSETFYTKTWERLRQEADDGGYADYALKVVGKLGLGDFASSMKVIGASSSFAFERNVVNGSFRVSLPNDYDGSPLTLRAIRRVDVRLLPPEKSTPKLNWCYVLLSDQTFDPLEQNSIVLNSFVSVTTKYSCGDGSPISLPLSPHGPRPRETSEGDGRAK